VDASLTIGGMAIDAALALATVAKHRRHVEASPGVGSGAQRYALAVLDDVEADLSALVTEIVVPPCPRCSARSCEADAHAVTEPCPLT
jgi:hypothetical protein